MASHNFLVLRDEQGNALAELHGLATDRVTGKVEPIGTDESRHSLRVWHYIHDSAYAASLGGTTTSNTYIQKMQGNTPLLVAEKTEVLDRWKSAVDMVARLNKLDRDYPNLVANVAGVRINSNSVYRTLSEAMGLPVYDFAGKLQPGLAHGMVPSEISEQYRDKTYPVLTRPTVEDQGKYRPLDRFMHGDGIDHERKIGAAPAVRIDNDGRQSSLLQQIRDGVASVDATTGRTPDAVSERMTWSLYALAVEQRLDRVDRVVLGAGGTRAGAGEYVFLVQGDPASSVYRREQMRPADAVDASIEQSQARVLVAERSQALELRSPAVEPVQQQAAPVRT